MPTTACAVEQNSFLRSAPELEGILDFDQLQRYEMVARWIDPSTGQPSDGD